jgi:hypothetical protein
MQSERKTRKVRITVWSMRYRNIFRQSNACGEARTDATFLLENVASQKKNESVEGRIKLKLIT